VHVALRSGYVHAIRVSVRNSTDRSPAAADAAQTHYEQVVTFVSQRLGPPAGQLSSDRPRTWWIRDGAAVSVSRCGLAVILTWATPEEHASLLEDEARWLSNARLA
jgi:hypothetical protein